jgi:hypothetical protein
MKTKGLRGGKQGRLFAYTRFACHFAYFFVAYVAALAEVFFVGAGPRFVFRAFAFSTSDSGIIKSRPRFSAWMTPVRAICRTRIGVTPNASAASQAPQPQYLPAPAPQYQPAPQQQAEVSYYPGPAP